MKKSFVLILLILGMNSVESSAKPNVNQKTDAIEEEEEFEDLHRTEIAIQDESLSAPALSTGERSTKVLERAKKIQIALYTLKCSKPTLVSPQSNPYKPVGANGDIFSVTSKDCKILKKNEASCEAGYEARNLPEALGAQKYKLCHKVEAPSTEKSGKTYTGLE